MTQEQKTSEKRAKNDWRKGEKPPVGKPFEKGNQAAKGHGRPTNIGSPRAMLKHYAERKAPEKLRRQIKKLYPEMTNAEINELSWAEVIALAHLAKSAGGDVSAMNATYKQIDDSGRDRTQLEFGEAVEDAARDFTSEVARLNERAEEE